MKYKKKFLILGNLNAITSKEIFPLIKNNKIWLGASIHSGDREFGIPDHYIIKSKSLRIDQHGNKFVRVVGVRWFTNLDYKKRHEDLILYKKYTPEEYPKYDNYDAININKTKEIPIDYDGVMGVPITFMTKYNPDQFEIIDGLNRYSILNGPTDKTRGKYMSQVNGKPLYVRIVIKHKNPSKS